MDILAAFLCAWRLADLVLTDKIFEWLRRFRPEGFNPARCIFCVTVWSGIVAVVLLRLAPLANYPLAFSQAVLVVQAALSWPSILKWMTERNIPKITILPFETGAKVDMGEFTKEQTMRIMQGLLGQMAKRTE